MFQDVRLSANIRIFEVINYCVFSSLGFKKLITSKKSKNHMNHINFITTKS